MHDRTWLPKKPKPPTKPRVSDKVRTAVDAAAGRLIAPIRDGIPPKPRKSLLNWWCDVFPRWRRESLYFVLVYRTPHGRPPTFEVHAARMEHVGGGKFDVAVPMRRGWNTVKRRASVEVSLKFVDEVLRSL